MGEVKNAFIKSKMNKDLDARLLPSGEYRNAINTQVSKSEGAGVGSLENALGNGLVVNFFTLTGINGLTSIGSLANELNDTMYVFLTNNTAAAYDKDAKNFIIAYNTLTNASSILVQGAFLNFSTLNKIYGINVLEDLLFWTDNRNQPRKINLSRALESSTYYSIEDQISVAKYNPYQSIELYRESDLAPGSYETTLYDVVSKFYPGGGTGDITGSVPNATTLFTVPPNSVSGDIVVGASIAYVDVSQNPPVLVNTGAIVSAYNPLGSTQLVTSISIGPFTGQLANLELIFNYNKYFDPTYNGDPNFLEDKFVRFAYRFQFEDGEYSIFSPFTQTAFTPKQDGYFMYNQPAPNPFNIDVDDESAAYRSTIVEFMENKVNKTLLVIPLPFTKGEITSTGTNPLRIISIDILYKESDALAVKVIDTIDMTTVKADTVGDNNSYIYNYQSKKPFKTLPADELIRVYDKVPVKAFGQEIISNRVVYSNFQDKHTPPVSLDYNLLISEKSPFNLNVSTLNVTDLGGNGTTTINATIIAGTVIVGGVLTGASIAAGSKIVSWSGSALETNKIQTLPASNYTLTVKPVGDEINTTSITEYPNHSLKQNRNYQVGVVLSDKFGRSSSVILSNSLTSINIGGLQYVGSTIYSPYRASGTDSYNWAGDSLKVLFNSVLSGQTANTNTNEPGVYEGDTTSSLYNPLGWYSYKIVVKQTEQEYYNVYLPGVLAAYPRNNTLELGKTSFAVLLNDNINKVPRDLSEVGPQQKQFRSSVQLFGRVENNSNAIPTANSQYFPGRFSSTVSTIATNNDLFNADDDLQYIATTDFYEIESNPLISKISTQKKFGVVTTASNASTSTSTTNATTILIDNVQGTPLPGDIVRGVGVAENTQVVSYNGTTDLVVDKQQSLSDNTFLTFTAQNASSEYSLAVFETTPVESNLDIFWESSSSGSVSELNTLILNESNGAGSLGGWSTGTFTEAVSNPQSITGAAGFTILDAVGATIPYASISSVTLTSVKTLESTPVEVFAVAAPRFSLSDELNGTYKVNTVAPSSNNFDWVYGINGIQNKSFIFYFTVVTLDSAGAEFSTQLIEYAALGNIDPAYVTNTNPPTPKSCPSTINKGTTGDLIVETFYGVNGANISDNTPTGIYLGIYEGLSFSISTVDSSGSAVSPAFIQTTTNWSASDPNTPFSCVVSKPAAFNTPGTYTVTLVLSDAGPATSICTFDVILTEDGCITVTRTSSEQYGGGATLSYTDCSGNPAVETWCANCCGDSRQISYLNGSPVPGQPSGGSTCCFVEGDEVEMYDGNFKSIDLIKVGDEVKSFKDGLIVNGVVTKALKHIVNGDAKVVKINGITGEQNHPVFINNEWVSLASQSKVSEEYVKNFYNLEIDGNKKDSEHNYVIGGLIASGLGDNVELNKLYQRQPLELTAHLK
jgi:hypothetical protein